MIRFDPLDAARASTARITHPDSLAPVCPICGATAWAALPNPQDRRAMLSDLRVIGEPLDKWICGGCSLVRRCTPVAPSLFASDYTLYAHAPGAPRETARQAAYAAWIAARCARPPVRVLDVGCGNASLLLALAKRWPAATMCGIDPSPEAIAFARGAGVDAETGTLASSQRTADLVLAVNVIEHTESPDAFVRGLAGAVEPGGTLLIICPDGEQPWSELLVADHLWSFTAPHVAGLLATAGVVVTSVDRAPSQIGRFMMIAGSRGAADPANGPDRHRQPAAGDPREYLQAWRDLDALLSARAEDDRLVCFGMGEAAGLLRAYAPQTWARVSRCVVDAPEHRRFGGLAVDDYGQLPPHTRILLGVRPFDQARVAERIEADGHRIIRWDDVVPA